MWPEPIGRGEGADALQIDTAVSLWNYGHYRNLKSLPEELALLRELGYGVELWSSFPGEDDLFGERARAWLRPVLEGMRVSLHTALSNEWEAHCKQIDAAAAWGAKVVVIHPSDLCADETGAFDRVLAREVVAYGRERGVSLALENGQLRFLAEAIEQVEGLGICLDVGHVYLTAEPMSAFLEALKSRLMHLHLQEVVAPAEGQFPMAARDHYELGTGGVPAEDWRRLLTTLQEIDFHGMGVFEIRPRPPWQTALRGTRFMDELAGMHRDAT
jgi:sugar phosphate isomerase/epimerase